MSDTVISVENLSKRYLIGHVAAKREHHPTMRDALVQGVRNYTRNATQALSGQRIVPSDEVEEFWALKDVSFEVKRGEVIGIIGRNGAGKSTLLKILSRITEPSEGRVTVQGRVASLLEVGTGFHPELTGRENIFLNGAILGMTRREIRRKFDAIVDFAEVEKFLDTPVKRYSSGMYVRLAFAVAAHLEPEILIVDEVLAVGDAEFQKKCLGKMEGVGREGRTVLFVSHQISTINQLCRRVVWLDRGSIVASGETHSILAKYLSIGSSDLPIATFQEPSDKTGLFFSKISVLDKDGNPSSELDALAPFHISLHYQVSKRLSKVELAIRVKTTDGMSVFTSAHSSDVGKMDKISGSYVATVQIPAQFLMPGSYTISAHAFQFGGRMYDPLHILDNIVRFTICETGTNVAKYNDHKNLGVVLVNFPWKEEVSLDAAEQTWPGILAPHGDRTD